jgi:hypothetical protein
VLLAGREPNDIAGVDLFDRATPSLRASAAGRDDEGLAERMGVPCCARAGLEGDVCANRARGLRRVEERIDTHFTGEVVGGSRARGLRATGNDFHRWILLSDFVSLLRTLQDNGAETGW